MLSENIKQSRKARGMSQEDLALALHVVRQTVSKWESDTVIMQLKCATGHLLEWFEQSDFVLNASWVHLHLYFIRLGLIRI